MNASSFSVEKCIRVFMFAVGAFTFLYALWCLFDAAGFIAMLEITHYQGATAPVEFRAGYGGMQAGLGLGLVWAALSARWWRAGVVVMTVWAGSLLLGRIYGVVVDAPEPLGEYLLGAFIFEILVTLSGLLALLLSRRAKTGG